MRRSAFHLPAEVNIAAELLYKFGHGWCLSIESITTTMKTILKILLTVAFGAGLFVTGSAEAQNGNGSAG